MNPTSPSPNVKPSKKRFVWGLICLIGPSALFIISLLGYALVNFLAGSPTPDSPNTETMFAEEPAWKPVANILLFLMGATTILTWLPGIIIGIVLLTKRKK